MRNLLMAFFCLTLTGCVATTNKYAGSYNDAVSSGHSIVIIKEGEFSTMEEGVEMSLNSIGYNKVLYSSPTEPFEVLVKSIEYGNPLLSDDKKESHKIFLKYTRIDAGHTRIDLVNGGTEISVKNEIDSDMQRLAASIKEN